MKKTLTLLLCVSLAVPTPAIAARLWTTGVEVQNVALITSGATPSPAAIEFDGESLATDPSVDTTTFRSGAASLHLNPSAAQMSRYKDVGSTLDNVYARFHLNIATCPSTADHLLFNTGDDGGGATSYAYLNTDCSITIWAIAAGGSGVDDIATSSVLDTGTWYCIEVFADTDSVTWNFQYRLDEVEFANGGFNVGVAADTDYVDFLSANVSKSTGTPGNGTADYYIDDIAVNSNAGATQNSWPGCDAKTVNMYPNAAGDTDNSTSTPNGHTNIDEDPTPDDATSVAWLDAISDILSVNMESSSNAGIDSYDTVNLVQVNMRGQMASAATGNYSVGIKSASGGTILGAAVFTKNDTSFSTNGDAADRLPRVTAYVDPTTGVAWTPTGTNSLDNMQLVASTTDANPDSGITSMWATVEYVDGSPPAGGTPIKVPDLFPII